MAAYDAVLFDFDGVIADTEPIHFACWSEVLAPAGIAVDWPAYRDHCIGLSERDTVDFFRRFGSPPPPFEEIWRLYPRKQDLFRARVLDRPPISAATRALIASLDRIAVVSSSSGSEIRPILEKAGLARYFSATVFAEDVEHPKPAPDPYLLAARRLGAERPLVVEDSATGVASARAAGFDVLYIDDLARMPELVRARLG